MDPQRNAYVKALECAYVVVGDQRWRNETFSTPIKD